MRLIQQSSSVIALCTLLTACGGGSESSSGTISVPTGGINAPSPAPTPTPTPTPLTPVIGTIFSNPTQTPSFRVVARGWQSSADADGTGFVSEGVSEDVSVSYSPATSSYQMAFPLLATNTMYRTSEFRYDDMVEGSRYDASLAATPTGAVNRHDIAVIRPGPATALYEHVAWLPWFTTSPTTPGRHRYSLGVVGVAQFTPNAQVPRTGTRRYVGRLISYMNDNLADLVVGRVEIDIDFAAGVASGTLYLSHSCMMGCVFPEIAYRLADVVYSPGGPRFDGKLSAGDPLHAGDIAGGYAGPNAEEMMLSFRSSYFDPNRKTTTLISGVGLARRL